MAIFGYMTFHQTMLSALAAVLAVAAAASQQQGWLVISKIFFSLMEKPRRLFEIAADADFIRPVDENQPTKLSAVDLRRTLLANLKGLKASASETLPKLRDKHVQSGLAKILDNSSDTGDYYYTGDSHYVGFQGSTNSRQFPAATQFRGTPLPPYQQEQFLQSSQPSAYQLPPTYDPYLQSQVRPGQAGFHTNQHLPQPFHPPSRRFPLTSSAADQSLDYGDDLGNSQPLVSSGSVIRGNPGSAYQEIVRASPSPGYQQPPSRSSPTPNSYQEIVRSTGASFFPSGLVDQLDSNRWRTSNVPAKRKPPTVAVPPPVEEPSREDDVNALPAVSSTSAYFSAVQDEPTTLSGRGRSRFKNVRVEATPFTVATTSSLPSRASRTRRPSEVRRSSTGRPTTLRPSTFRSTTTTTTTTESPHYDPDYELEYILEPDEDGMQEDLPALLGPNNNLTSLPLRAPLIPNLKFEEDLSAAFLPPGYKKESATSTEPAITTFGPRARLNQGSPKPSPTTFRPSTTTTTTTTRPPTTASSPQTEAASLQPPVTPEPDSSSESPTESWVIVASVQTSRSVSGARFLPGQVVKQEETQKPLSPNGTIIEKAEDVTEKPVTQSTPAPSPPSTKGSTESIIDKLDRVQSELSSGILSGFRPGDSKLDIPDMHENKTVSETPTVPPTTEPPTKPSEATSPSTTTEATTSRPRTFVPAGKRTTLKPKKSLVESIKFDELDSLLPPGFKPRESSFKPKTSREGSGRSAGSTFKNSVKEEGKTSGSNKTLESILGKISFDDVSSLPGYNGGKSDGVKVAKEEAPASLLPPGFKLPAKAVVKEDEIPDSLLPPGFKKEKSKSASSEDKKIPLESILKKVEFKDVSALLPPGFKEKSNAEPDLAGLLPPGFKLNATESPKAAETTKATPQLPTRPTRKPPPSSKTKSGGGLAPPPPKIQKGWPVRATTEFTGWPSPATTPISVEKILEKARQDSAKILEYNRLATSTDAPPSTRASVTTTVRTTTTREPTTPGVCERDCDMAATLRLVGGAKWVPELLDHNTLEWKQLANEVESQLEAVYSSSDSLSRWYKKITIDAFSEGSVLVDYFVELTELGRTVNTADMKRLFHESLSKYTANQAALTGDTSAASNTNNNQTEYRLGNFVVDPNYTDFIVLPRQAIPTVGYAEENELLPQWAIAVIVIGLASLLFVIIFGVTVLVNRHKSAKKKQPTVLTEDMLSELNKNHMGGLDNFGADDLYNMEDVWADKPVNKRSSGSIQENSMANLYDSWRSEWNGYYYNAYYGNGEYDGGKHPQARSSSSGYGLGRRRSDYDTNF